MSRLLHRGPQLPRHQPNQPRIALHSPLVNILELLPPYSLLPQPLVRSLEQVDGRAHGGVFARQFGGVRLPTVTGEELPGASDGVVHFGGGDYFGQSGQAVGVGGVGFVEGLLRRSQRSASWSPTALKAVEEENAPS
jgi:hypothetical protein